MIYSECFKDLIEVKELGKNLKFAWKYAKDQKKYLWFLIITNIISIILNIIFPILSAKIIVELTNNEFLRIIFLGGIIFALELISSLIGYVSMLCSLKLYRNTLSVLEVDLGHNILKIENECLDKHGSGVFIQRLINDTSKIADGFNNILDLVSEIIRYTGILIAILIVNRIVFLYTILILVVLYILENKKAKKRNEDDKIYRKTKEKVSGFIGELVRGARDIKMLNSEKDFIKELKVRIEESNDKKMTMEKNSLNRELVIWFIRDAFAFTLIILLVYLMHKQMIIPTTALILYNYTRNIPYSVNIIGRLLEYIKDFNLSSERIYAILNSDEFQKEKFGTKHLDKMEGNFEFKNVCFAYKDKNVLNQLSFKINANETVAFVGKSGAGKTTIFNLICKMYDINMGEISIDGVNINDLDKDSIRGNITTISQNPYIFNMSIRDNFRLVKSNLTDEEMKKACKIACLEDFIKELPDGYDTIIGEGGINLSGGQKQRLAIARALIQKTEIILFDEATSALDNETQGKIQQAIENMKNEYTILIIAHRLSTIINADRILYLENGKIEMEGTHDQLLKKCPKYRKLYESEMLEKESDIYDDTFIREGKKA